VIAADGIAGDFLRNNSAARPIVNRRSRVGIGAVVDDGSGEYQPGMIYMACGKTGYCGVVRTEDNYLNIAAAVDPHLLRATRDPALAASQLLQQAHLPEIDGITSAHWRGTPSLTRRRRIIASERLFIQGDSAAYVEPFTGEGIAWALLSAAAAADLAERAARQWTPDLMHQWQVRYDRLLGAHHYACRLLAMFLRSPTALKIAMRMISVAPSFTNPIVNFVHSSRRSCSMLSE
jgi:flavin-dependent dehydrogenase